MAAGRKPRVAGADFQGWREANVRVQRQPGFVSVLIRSPQGDLRPAQIRQIAAVARRHAGGIRTSIDQQLLLRWVREGSLPDLFQQFQSVGLAGAGQAFGITRCVGAAACLMAITHPRPAAAAIAGALEPELAADASLRDLRIRISGCPNSCGHHHAADIGLFGVSKTFHSRPVPHYAVLLGGVSSAEAFGARVLEVPALNVGQAVREIVVFYRSARRTSEGFAAFVGRVGLAAVKERVEPWTAVAAPAVQPAFYCDLGSTQPFAVGVRGGECAA